MSAGYLTLDGETGWKRYWFVLSGSSVGDVALRYYTHTESARDGAVASVGSMFLKGSRVVQIQEMIRITGSADATEEWFLCADTEKEATTWSEKIEMASRAPEQCVEAVGGWGMGGDASRLSSLVERQSSIVSGEGGGDDELIGMIGMIGQNENGGQHGGNEVDAGNGTRVGIGGGGGNGADGTDSTTATSASNGGIGRRTLTHRKASSQSEAREIHRRRSLELLHQRHDEFVMCFKQCNVDRLRDMAASGGLQYSTIRSIVWTKLMGHFPMTTHVNIGRWTSIVHDSREEYTAVSTSVLVSSRDVTGRVSKEVKETTSSRERSGHGNGGMEHGGSKKGRPLSSDTAGAIFQYMLKSDFQRQIWKDVVRTQQSIAWFVEKETQDLIARILLVWSLAHPDVGYKQGMNELLAVILYLVCTERGGLSGKGHLALLKEVTEGTEERNKEGNKEGNKEENKSKEFDAKQMHIHGLLDVLLDPQFCEHDAYLIFSLVMVRMEPVFCPTDEKHDTPHTLKRDAMSLLQRFSRVQAEIVHLENPELAEHMIMCGVEPHMYLLRWMRLLCSREFNMPGLWLVWDATIAVNPNSFEFNDFICAALVLSLNDSIRENDDAQSILYELQNFTQGFNIDIVRLLELARNIKTRLTGKLMESTLSVVDGEDEEEDEGEGGGDKEVHVEEEGTLKGAINDVGNIPCTEGTVTPKKPSVNVMPSPSPHTPLPHEPLLHL